jgi:serine/threonine protein kinase
MAVKMLEEDNIQVYRFMAEIDCLAACDKLGCRHVIPWDGLVFSSKGRLGYAMPAATGTLRDLVMELPPDVIQQLFFQLVTGLCEIQRAGYIHRDIKLANIVGFWRLLDGMPDLRSIYLYYIDTGMGKCTVDHATGRWVSQVGTIEFMAPELLRQRLAQLNAVQQQEGQQAQQQQQPEEEEQVENGQQQVVGQVTSTDLTKMDVFGLGLVIGLLALPYGRDLGCMFEHDAVLPLLDSKKKQLEEQLTPYGFQAASGSAFMGDEAAKAALEQLYLVEQVGLEQVLGAMGDLAAAMGEQGMDLLKGMLQLQPRDRLTAREAWFHPYFTAERERLLASKKGSFKDCTPLLELLQQARDEGKCSHRRYKGSCTRCLAQAAAAPQAPVAEQQQQQQQLL